ncbi:MAG TPA: ABC transporter permease [Candidatus Thermoplasmatota archaeon]|nr:ABC transporter permease [Candidatus Thermoplasmatota archaeon]
MASRGLPAYVLQRVLLAVPMLLILVTFVFLLLHVAPGDPVLALAPQGAPPETIERIRHDLGFDKPMWRQYVDYVLQLAHFDLGDSYTARGVTVWSRIGATFPATLELTMGAMAVALGVGLVLGALAGAKRGGWLDLLARLFGILIYSAPVFWLGLIAILLFSVLPHEAGYAWALPSGSRGVPAHWGWGSHRGEIAETTGMNSLDSLLALDGAAFWDNARHLVLPATTLGLVIGGIFVRITRVNMLQTMRADYVDAARARGVAERHVIFRHALKNALIPVITIVGLTFALLLGGAVLTENVFNWPGIARELTRAIANRDYPLVQGITIFIGSIVILVSIAIDLLNAAVDPRVRYS